MNMHWIDWPIIGLTLSLMILITLATHTQMSFAIALIAITVYVLLSLLSRRPPATMDKLLHRGESLEFIQSVES